MKNLLLPVTAAILVFSSLAAQATPLIGPAQPPLTGHYKPKWTQGPDMIDADDNLSMHQGSQAPTSNQVIFHAAAKKSTAGISRTYALGFLIRV